MWQYHPILQIFQLGALISVGIAAYCAHRLWRYGRSDLVVAVGFFAFNNAIYNVAATLKVASPSLNTKLLMYKLEFLGGAVNPSVAIALALVYLGYRQWLSRTVITVLFLIPAIVIPLILINPGNVMIVEPYLVLDGGIYALEHRFPPLFVAFVAWAQGAYVFAGLLIGFGVVSRNVRRIPGLLVCTALILPIVAVTLKMSGMYPPGGEGINVTPAFGTVMVALIALAIGRYRLFDLLPVGRNQALDVMKEGYVLIDATDEIVDANDAARDLLSGSRNGTLTGRPASEILPTYDALDGGTDATTFTKGNRVLQMRSSRIMDGTQFAGRILMLHDITPLRERERELNRENERLENFVGVVSHDLRNPLNVATGRLELARDEVESEHLQATDRALDRMRQLIDHLLILARQGESIDEEDMQAVPLQKIAQTCWEHVDTEQADLETETTGTIIAVEQRLRQLFENLFRNAVEHGGEDVTVTIGDLEDGFYVEDDGPGIDADDPEQLFESGYSTNSSGTGFGLSIVKEIANAHGWSLQITEGREQGARFEITDVDTPESPSDRPERGA